jgi:uncharacterized protein (DUF58 family)
VESRRGVVKLPIPTALGVKAILFYAVLLAAFFAAPYANLFFLLMIFLTVLGVLGLLWTARNLAGVAAEVEDVEPIPAGTGGELRARVDAGRRPRFGLIVELFPEGVEAVAARAAEARGETMVSGTIPPLPRGLYRVRGARLSSTWPLGLLRARRSLEAPEEIVVYPTPADLAERASGAGGPGDLVASFGRSAGMLQPSELREYRSGDDPRRIHWKASARRASLVVKEFDGGSGAGIEALLDRRCESGPLEEALSLLSALALVAKDRKELLTLHSQGHSATFGTGHRPWRELLRFLAGAESLGSDGPPPPPVSPGILRLPRPAASGGGP